MTILHKRSDLVGAIPAISDLELGELAINTKSGELYTKKEDENGNLAIVSIGGSGALRELDQGNGIGWTVQYRIDNPDNYGIMGQGAVDFTSSDSPSTTIGATGLHSFACGKLTTASGDEAHAEGYRTEASGYASHTEGYHTEASGDNSHAEGYETEATGGNSHAEGYNTAASGNNSHAEGTYTTASSNNSHAEGSFTIAQNKNQHSAGRYNIGTSADTIHETGIGIDDYNRKNAFEIYTDGTLKAPETTPCMVMDDEKNLVTVETIQDRLTSGLHDNDYTVTDTSNNVFTLDMPTVIQQVLLNGVALREGSNLGYTRTSVSNNIEITINAQLNVNDWVQIKTLNLRLDTCQGG